MIHPVSDMGYSCSADCSTDSKCPESSPLVRPRKRVRFSTCLDVKEVPVLLDVPKEEIEATWYTPDEFAAIKKTLVTTVRLMMAKKPIEEGLCIRGLEFRTPAGAKNRKKNKMDALTAVWNEQVAQWKEDRTDEEAISIVYQQQVIECRNVALRLAAKDELEARAFHSMESSNESASDFSVMSLDDPANLPLEEPHRSTVVPTAA